MALKQQVLRNRYVLIIDAVMIAVAVWSAFALRFGWLFMETRVEFAPFIVAAVVIKLTVFYWLGMYLRYWRYASFWDLMAVVLANSVASLILGVAMVGLRLADVIPELSRAVLPLDGLVCLALTTGVRASIRVIAETM